MDLLLSLRQSRAWEGFPNFMQFILAVSSIQCLSFAILFNYKVDSGLNNNMETDLKIKQQEIGARNF